MPHFHAALAASFLVTFTFHSTWADDERVLASVNGTPITAADLELQLVLFGEDVREDPAVRAQLLDRLIDQQLISQWLDERSVEVDEEALDARIELLERVVEANGQSLDEVLKRFGRTSESLREEQSLPVRWSSYVNRVITEDRIEEHFDAHRAELDGTRLRLSQIVLTVGTDEPMEAWDEAQMRLQSIRDEIASGAVTFEEAARMHSDSPTAEEGGDVGFVNFRGDLPTEVTRAAFALDTGELSEPIRSPFGVHLVRVTDRQPGQLSLEDVRDKIIDWLGDELWEIEVQRLKETATIQRLTESP